MDISFRLATCAASISPVRFLASDVINQDGRAEGTEASEARCFFLVVCVRVCVRACFVQQRKFRRDYDGFKRYLMNSGI